MKTPRRLTSALCPTLSCQSFRQSRGLVIVVVFVALMLDVMLMTCVDPILPDMLERISNNTKAAATNSSGNTTTIPFPFNVPDVDSYWSINMQIGVMVAAKPATEMISNLAVGVLVDRVGHRWPMTAGFAFNVLATVGFAYSPTFWLLMLTRVAQAIGSSLSVVAGLAYLATVFTDDTERGKATGRAFGGVSLGIILGYPFGSIVYDLLGREAPFLILAGVSFLDGVLRLLLVTPSTNHDINNNEQSKEDDLFGSGSSTQEQISSCSILSDGRVWICLGCVFIQHAGLGIFLATGPAWMLNDLHSPQWTIGTVLGICVIFHLIAQITVGELGITRGRWLALWIGLAIFSIGIATYPLCRSIWEVLGPEITVRIGHGMALCVLSPLLAHLVDLKHGGGSYGSVYGLYTTFYNMGLTLGPVLGGILINYMSFSSLYWSTGAAILVYSTLCVLLRPAKINQIYLKPKKKDALIKSTSDYGSIEEVEA